MVTITKETWPNELVNHWHIVDTFLSRHLVGSVHAVYGSFAEIVDYEWDDEPPLCHHCGERMVSRGKG